MPVASMADIPGGQGPEVEPQAPPVPASADPPMTYPMAATPTTAPPRPAQTIGRLAPRRSMNPPPR
ncbi:hypothetical protein [Kitasatospora purpeofusca]|uniref:Uncharacterized protein n=1 Tax=Kitasatospora purpeofusca TaxID=67352 RepID=A0ABZ1TYF0_9ACTN|nr:hypothetical protein [Kitasatospora purpeofusca]